MDKPRAIPFHDDCTLLMLPSVPGILVAQGATQILVKMGSVAAAKKDFLHTLERT